MYLIRMVLTFPRKSERGWRVNETERERERESESERKRETE